MLQDNVQNNCNKTRYAADGFSAWLRRGFRRTAKDMGGLPGIIPGWQILHVSRCIGEFWDELDNYSACGTFNQGVFSATVKPKVTDVNWEASSFYFHWCLLPYEWEDGYLKYGTVKHQLTSDPNHDDRRGSHAFTNTHGGTTWYSVSAMFFYDAW